MQIKDQGGRHEEREGEKGRGIGQKGKRKWCTAMIFQVEKLSVTDYISLVTSAMLGRQHLVYPTSNITIVFFSPKIVGNFCMGLQLLYLILYIYIYIYIYNYCYKKNIFIDINLNILF